MTADLSYTGQTVRKHDPDRFLLSLFAPMDRREALWALYAFNYEIAKTREVVTDTHLGLIRLQWWRDALAAYFDRGEVLKHQVIEPLMTAIKDYNLPRELFDNLIFAREFDLEDRLPSNLEGLVKYAEFTNAPLVKLSLIVLGEGDEGADNIAAAYGLTGLLRAVPAHLRQQRCYLPEDLLTAQGLTAYDLYDGDVIDKIQPVIQAIMPRIEELLRTGVNSRYLKRMKKLTAMYFNQLKKADGNVFASSLKAPPFLKEIRLLF